MSYFKQVEQKLKKSSGVRILLLDSQNEKVKQAVQSIGILSNIKFFKLEDLIDIKNIKEEENNLARFIELTNGTFNYESTKKLFATNKTLFHSLVLLKEKRIDGIIGGLTSSFETFVDSLKSSLSYLNEDKIISFVSFAQNEEKHFFMSYTNEVKKNEVNLLSQVAVNLNEYKKEISDLGDLVLLNKDLNQSKLLEVIKNIDPSIKVQNQVRLNEALDTNQNW
ncbi:phosphate acetyltransferase(phosphotransacetylase), partial [Mycoplasmopsis edwardii]